MLGFFLLDKAIHKPENLTMTHPLTFPFREGRRLRRGRFRLPPNAEI
jgi:hypothetical protein